MKKSVVSEQKILIEGFYSIVISTEIFHAAECSDESFQSVE